ncbi:MAG: hypothetical protein ACQESM_09290 [Bacteroidota bacterium]
MKQLLLTNMRGNDQLSLTEGKVIVYPHLRLEGVSKGETYHDGDLTIVLQGTVSPRLSYYDAYKHLHQHDLINTLYKKYQSKFVNYIKGSFIILILTSKETKLFSDHLGLQTLYLFQKGEKFSFTNNINTFRSLGIELIPDELALISKSLIHRVPIGKTQFKNITKTKPASHITIENCSLTFENYWSPSELLSDKTQIDNSLDFKYFAELIKTNFANFLEYFKPQQNAITLTGGKDSRTGLAALRCNGAEVIGFTYGNEKSRDAIYAKYLAKSIGVPHHIFKPDDSEKYFSTYFSKIIEAGNPDISLHRSHRLFAFDKMASTMEGNSAYYAGYMAGEFLMGIYYDNLVFTKYLTHFWDFDETLNAKDILSDYYHTESQVKETDIVNYFSYLNSFDVGLSREERQFYALFEIGIPHHGQDVFLADQEFDVVFPFFMDIDFLEALFKSRYNLFFTDNKTKNLLDRYKLFEFNLNIQHLLCPELDNIHFGKRGSYNTKEFLRGKYYWTGLKIFRYVFQRQKYPSTYVYGQAFRDYLLKHLRQLFNEKDHPLHMFFNVSECISDLKAIQGSTDEKTMHKYSNIVQYYHQLQT